MSDLVPYTLDITDVTGQLSERSRRIYTSDARSFAVWMIEHSLAIESLTRSNLIAYRQHLADGYRVATAQRMFSVARSILAEYTRSGRLTVNPSSDIKGFKVSDESSHLALSRAQARELVDSVDITTMQGKRDFALLMFLLKTGLRRSECSALNIGDIKMEQGHYIAVIEHGKGDKRGIAKVQPEVFRLLQEYLDATKRNAAPDAPLFVHIRRGGHPTNERLSDKAIERIVKSYGEAIGIPELTPHCLRATFITLALEAKATLEQVQYAARHKDPRTTERYRARKLNLDDNGADYVKF